MPHGVAGHKARRVSTYVAQASKVVPHDEQITLTDLSYIHQREVNNLVILYGILVCAVGANTVFLASGKCGRQDDLQRCELCN